MRQLVVQVPRGHGDAVLEIAKEHDGANLALFEATGSDGPVDVAIVHVSNGKIEGMMAGLQSLPDLHVTLIPRGIIALQPPPSEAPDQVIDVEARSPIEIFLAGLQSVGSWKGFLGYAAAAGVVVWIGLFTNTIFLLVASMLIAPFAGPAMNTAIATARGDGQLLRQALVRYFVSLAVTIGVAALLSLVSGQTVATDLMVQTAQVSATAVLLPLVAGAAGALNLIQSQRNSLVSGASVGFLVAASLAPPAGLIGMAGAIGRWDMALSGLYLLPLQLAGINLAGAIVFRASGLTPQGVRYERGKQSMFVAILGVTMLALAGLLVLQFSSSPELQRPTRAQRAAAEIQDVTNKSGLAELVEANVRFTRANIEDQNTLLSVVYVQRRSDVTLPDEEIRNQITRAIQQRLRERGFNVTPLIDVNVLGPPTRDGEAATAGKGVDTGQRHLTVAGESSR